MILKELCAMLDQVEDRELPVIVRCAWPDDGPAHNQFELAYIRQELEPDTGDDVIYLECRQDG